MTDQTHSFSGSGQPPSEIQRGLSGYDRDTIAYLAQMGAGDAMLERVLRFGVKDPLPVGEALDRIGAIDQACPGITVDAVTILDGTEARP